MHSKVLTIIGKVTKYILYSSQMYYYKIKADVSTAILQSSSEDTQNAHKTLLIYKQSSIVIVDIFLHLSALCHYTMMSFWVYNVYMH